MEIFISIFKTFRLHPASMKKQTSDSDSDEDYVLTAESEKRHSRSKVRKYERRTPSPESSFSSSSADVIASSQERVYTKSPKKQTSRSPRDYRSRSPVRRNDRSYDDRESAQRNYDDRHDDFSSRNLDYDREMQQKQNRYEMEKLLAILDQHNDITEGQRERIQIWLREKSKETVRMFFTEILERYPYEKYAFDKQKSYRK